MKATLFVAVSFAVLCCGSDAFAQAHGTIEFDTNGTWLVPKKVKQVQVELWGSGGNGGSGYIAVPNKGGGGGGAGGYARGWVTVKANQVYQVNVGTSAGSGAARSSWFADPAGTQLLAGSGGAHGNNGTSGGGGLGGAGGAGTGAGMLLRNGAPGGNGAVEVGGPGAQPVQGSVALPAGVGKGGNGGIFSSGLTGGRGHVILSW